MYNVIQIIIITLGWRDGYGEDVNFQRFVKKYILSVFVKSLRSEYGIAYTWRFKSLRPIATINTYYLLKKYIIRCSGTPIKYKQFYIYKYV